MVGFVWFCGGFCGLFWVFFQGESGYFFSANFCRVFWKKMKSLILFTKLAKLRENYTTKKQKQNNKKPQTIVLTSVQRKSIRDNIHNLQQRQFQLSITIGKNFTWLSIKSCPESWRYSKHVWKQSPQQLGSYHHFQQWVELDNLKRSLSKQILHDLV